ncbi:MAG: SgcJ/EcaC family oxidoreductase [Verrucomicrobia bacterium]|nr:SgcJ/EcaC family oxidoreductase [Verrucomicrobiota bacterium]
MRKHHLIHTILPLAIGFVVGGGAVLQAAEADSRQAAVFTTANAFVEAFHKGDAKALAAFWTPDGDYVDDTGRVLQGREAIEKSYAELFAAHPGMKLRIDVASLKFPTPDTAVEDGTSVVIPPDGTAPSRARYTNMFVKTGEQWLLASVREFADPGPSNYENLRGLEWAIGEWLDAAPAAGAAGQETGHVSFVWAPGQNFIISTRTVDYKDASLLQATQWIGWDAAAKQIRSWGFQADGGVSQSIWTRDGDKWVVKTEATLADGSKVTSTNIAKPVAPNAFTWQSKEQKLNGQPLPDTNEVKMTRAN